MRKITLYPFWLRFWHWLNALLFLTLIISGIFLHYLEANPLHSQFQLAIFTHNASGVLLSFIYIFYVIRSITSGNIRSYIPKFRGLPSRFFIQIRYYLIGILNKEPKPFHPTENERFNPLQQLFYLAVMFIFMPVVIITGWSLLLPELSPDEFLGLGGIYPMAVIHIIASLILTIFFVMHVYLGSTGKSVMDLFKSMWRGWRLVEEHEEREMEQAYALEMERRRKKKKFMPVVFYNPLTMGGALLSLISFVAILFLMALEYFNHNTKAYVGIITFVILPGILMIGVLLVIIGAFKEHRRLLAGENPDKQLPVIDLNNPKHQIATIVFSVLTILILTVTVISSFKAYEYTDSDEFCGTICHQVMHPEFLAYQNSPHSRVHCVKCHIGPGAKWFVKAKISGLYQVYSVLFNKFSRPIPTPIEGLRPAQQTCEQCHWPKHFYGEKKITFDFYTTDEKNSGTKLSMILKTGGGSPEHGYSEGIHYHMNILNEMTYYPADEFRQDIPVVFAKNLQTGKVTEYRSTESKINFDTLKQENFRIMDCIDCHNRPSHIYHQPNKIVNTYLTQGKIDTTLPYIKNLSVQAVESQVKNKLTAYNEIKTFIWKFYESNYPKVFTEKKEGLEKSVNNIHKIYSENYYPEMKVSWRKFSNNIGHLYGAGCFRCHDGKHKSPEGKVISMDCNLCHVIIDQKAPNGQKNTFDENGNINFIHPGGMNDFISGKPCFKCHGVRR
ncbi:MAG: Cytochrome c family protein [Ignavibacteria bacterium]|nr:Cytochrome c family protein [Ignavibacteria bacterium]